MIIQMNFYVQEYLYEIWLCPNIFWNNWVDDIDIVIQLVTRLVCVFFFFYIEIDR